MAASGTKRGAGGARRGEGDSLVNSGPSAGGARSAGRGQTARSSAAGAGSGPSEAALAAVEARYPEGIQVAALLKELGALGLTLSEATFRKWVQQGLLPRSVRVGRPGKHQGSQGFYPASVMRRIVEIRRLMSSSLTVDDIVQTLRFRDELGAIERGITSLLSGLTAQLDAPPRPGMHRLEGAERRSAEKLLEQLRREAGELVRRLGELERRVVTPLEREAKARAFGTGATGGADELL